MLNLLPITKPAQGRVWSHHQQNQQQQQHPHHPFHRRQRNNRIAIKKVRVRLLGVVAGTLIVIFFLVEILWYQSQPRQQPPQNASSSAKSRRVGWNLGSRSSSSSSPGGGGGTSTTTTTTTTTGEGGRGDEGGGRDGFFNGAPLTLRMNVTNPQTVVHCVGDNYFHLDQAWKGRSCHFSSLFCFNTTNHRFVVFESLDEHLLRRFQNRLHKPGLMHSSSTMTTTYDETNTTTTRTTATTIPTSKSVSLGGINLKWGEAGIRRLQWFPDIQSNVTQLTYYELPKSVIWIPFHSFNGANPGHLVWDDFLSIYNLLDMFDLLDNHNNHKNQNQNQNQNHHPNGNKDENANDPIMELLFMRFILNDKNPNGLWASCDWNEKQMALCHHMIDKFIPLMVGTKPRAHWSTTQNFDFQPFSSSSSSHPPPLMNPLHNNHNPQPLVTDLVCASHGVAGIGALTDHGFSKTHGWVPEDYEFIHNHGRGGLIRAFRNFAVQNLPVSTTATAAAQPLKSPPRIVFSVNSSDIPARNLDFARQIELVHQYIPTATVESHVFQHLTLVEQIDLARQTDILVTLCGGGAVTAMFLPPGASVILYYLERGGIRAGKHGNVLTHTPALLDWDLFSAMTHIQVHWMPRMSMDEFSDQMAFLALIRRILRLVG